MLIFDINAVLQQQLGDLSEKTISLQRAFAGGGAFRPHNHCPKCWSERTEVVDGKPVCPACAERPEMIVCTPIVCGSS